MEYRHSTVIDPSTYGDLGLCCSIPLRVSNFDHLANKGSWRARDDWKLFTGKIPEETGCLCHHFNFISATIPECRPERIEVLAYLSEYAFFHDGVIGLQ